MKPNLFSVYNVLVNESKVFIDLREYKHISNLNLLHVVASNHYFAFNRVQEMSSSYFLELQRPFHMRS